MKKQDYKNHRRYYPPHHFIFLPMIAGFIILGVYNSFRYPDKNLEWALFCILSFSILYLALMLRQHYALSNQNRIVRLEFRLRYFELMGKSAQTIEHQLSFGQIAALRFADDNEFKILLDKALHEGMDSDAIKRAITNWQADDMRV